MMQEQYAANQKEIEQSIESLFTTLRKDEQGGKVLHAEYGAAFILLLSIYVQLDFSLWLFFLLLLVPDVTMVGYFMNAKIGATLYNFGHNLIVPIICCGLSTSFSNDMLLMLALIWLAHILMDCFLGYGLKYPHSFKQTHLQRL